MILQTLENALDSLIYASFYLSAYFVVFAMAAHTIDEHRRATKATTRPRFIRAADDGRPTADIDPVIETTADIEPEPIAIERVTENPIDLTALTARELKRLAADRRVKSYGKMTKTQLIAALTA